MKWLTAIVVLCCVLPGAAVEASGETSTVRIAAVTQSWAGRDRTLAHVLDLLGQAAAQRAQIAVLPQDCVPCQGGADAKAALAAITRTAVQKKLYVVANLKEQDAGRLYSTSYLIGSDGRLKGKYRKSHRLPDETLDLGSALPVFDTPWGKVGLMIGTDHYWPEVPLVMALDGAELIAWSNSPEPVPQGYPLEIKIRTRAIDDHVTVAAADYVGSVPYLCSNWPAYTGQPLGRSYVINRSGSVVADTGFQAGVAVAEMDLKRRKDIYHLTFVEDRKLFHDLVEPVKPVVHQGAKRKIRITIAQVTMAHGPNPKPDSPFARILDEAGSQSPDVVVMSEFGYSTITAEAGRTFALVAEKARRYKTYIVIGGLRDPELPDKNGRATSWAYLWDRQGKVVAKYRISQYGLSKELPVFKTDFGVVGLILCGDIYSQEIVRAMAVKGAELILCGSQSWGASGMVNLWMQQTRAMDNSLYMVTTHFPMSEVSQRSYVIDPYGYPLAATQYWCDCVASAEVDLDSPRVWFARSDKPGTAGRSGYLAGYYPQTVPEKRTDFRAVLLAGRRPELYRPIVEKTLADRHFTEATQQLMSEPRKE